MPPAPLPAAGAEGMPATTDRTRHNRSSGRGVTRRARRRRCAVATDRQRRAPTRGEPSGSATRSRTCRRPVRSPRSSPRGRRLPSSTAVDPGAGAPGPRPEPAASRRAVRRPTDRRCRSRRSRSRRCEPRSRRAVPRRRRLGQCRTTPGPRGDGRRAPSAPMRPCARPPAGEHRAARARAGRRRAPSGCRAERRLHGDRAFGGQAVTAAVVRRLERHAVVVDRGRQGEHLVPAGVGQHVAGP